MLLLGLLAAVVYVLVSYHLILRRGGDGFLLVYPKEHRTFSRTFVDTSDWGLSDAWQNRDLVGMLGDSFLALLQLHISGEVSRSQDREIALGRLKEKDFYCSWTEHWVTCVKL